MMIPLSECLTLIISLSSVLALILCSCSIVVHFLAPLLESSLVSSHLSLLQSMVPRSRLPWLCISSSWHWSCFSAIQWFTRLVSSAPIHGHRSVPSRVFLGTGLALPLFKGSLASFRHVCPNPVRFRSLYSVTTIGVAPYRIPRIVSRCIVNKIVCRRNIFMFESSDNHLR